MYRTSLRHRPLIESIPASSPQALQRAFAAYRRLDPICQAELDGDLTLIVERVKRRAEARGYAPPSFSASNALELLACLMDKGYL